MSRRHYRSSSYRTLTWCGRLVSNVESCLEHLPQIIGKDDCPECVENSAPMREVDANGAQVGARQRQRTWPIQGGYRYRR